MIEYEKKYDLAYKQAIVMYLRQRCAEDAALLEACKKENKSLDGIVRYIKQEAQKQSKDGMACVPDATVYEWAVHYILEDSINCENKTTDEDLEYVDTIDDWAKRKSETRAKEESEISENKKDDKKETIADQLLLF